MIQTAHIASVTKAGAQSWRFALTGTAPFQVYQAGAILAADLDDTEIVIDNDDAYEPPAIEVLDADDVGTPEQVDYPPTLTIQWRGDSGTDYYRVDEYTDGAWVQRQTYPEDGKGYYKHNTGPLADVTTHTWRVVPVDEGDNEGSALTVETFMVRNPDPPSISMTYNATTGDLEVRPRA